MSALSDRIAGHVNNIVATKQKELEAWQNFRRAAMSRGGMPDLTTIAELNSVIAEAHDVAHEGMREIDAIARAINADMPQQTPAGQIAPKTSNAASPRKSAQYTPVSGAGPSTGGAKGGSYAMRRSPTVYPNTGSMYVKYTDGELRERLEKIAKARSRLLDELSRREARDAVHGATHALERSVSHFREFVHDEQIVKFKPEDFKRAEQATLHPRTAFGS